LGAPKKGFVIPALWLRGPLRGVVERFLAPERLRRQGLLGPAFYDAYVRPHLEARANHTLKVWGAMMFQFWHRRFVEGIDLDLGIGAKSSIGRT
jgi:asparagine synthase (glutamine-hydrolysing)